MFTVINLRGMSRVCILGGGTAGWFAALEMRKLFSSTVEVMVISAPEVPIIGVGEGGLLNLVTMLSKLDIELGDFIEKTGATIKLGFRYERWRTGKADDTYYHMFPIYTKELEWQQHGYYPYLSLLVNHGIDVGSYMDSIQLSKQKAPQSAVIEMLINKKNNFGASLHFDTFRVGQYFKEIALSRGIIFKEGFVQDLILHPETGHVTTIQLVDQFIDCNFLIDASGFSRLAIGKKLNTTWHSFSDSLIMNRAIPFQLKHGSSQRELLTCATAMQAGWVWQIPLQERIGAGYVFNSDFLTEDQAVEEVEEWLGYSIDPIRTISFEAGYFEKVWQGNVLAIGLASGFVEPLEATSIGQMLAQVDIFTQFVLENHGIIPQQTIDYFNQQNAKCWQGIRDFIRMHYDTGRCDNAFWQHVCQLPISEQYAELKQSWQHRTPRKFDLIPYDMDGVSIFEVPNWLAVGVAVGIIPPEATAAELMVLKPEQHQLLASYLNQLKSKPEMRFFN